ncbi:MAG: hypothetical protein K2W95_11100 [Candidatus Obscuribacterales bacterium]|nr:hypothetical protein [Candidatus Obscuribacterales bacterium]
MVRSFLQDTLRQTLPTPYVVSHKGITGTGEVLAFCGFIIDAQAGRFEPDDAVDIARAAANLFEHKDRVVKPAPPKKVAASYGITTVPHFVPRLHVLEESGAEFVGDVLFDFEGEPIGIITESGEVIRLVA